MFQSYVYERYTVGLPLFLGMLTGHRYSWEVCRYDSCIQKELAEFNLEIRQIHEKLTSRLAVCDEWHWQC